MSAMTIIEFLEARIAEDAARFDLPEFALEESAHGYGWGNRGHCPLCDSYQFSGLESVTEEGWWAHAEDAHRMRQRLAECAAKRAILGDYLREYRMRSEMDRRNTNPAIYYGLPSDKVLRQITSVYADHPDYQQEWSL